jgi:hypothetical protein
MGLLPAQNLMSEKQSLCRSRRFNLERKVPPSSTWLSRSAFFDGL